MRKGTLKKALALALTGAVLVGAFAGCGAKKDSGDKKETKKIVIGASPSPHADILKVAKKELKKEGYELEIKEYSDYVQPNTALESLQLLVLVVDELGGGFVARHKAVLLAIAGIFLLPFGREMIHKQRRNSISTKEMGFAFSLFWNKEQERYGK